VHDDNLKLKWGNCLKNAIISSGIDFASKVRSLRIEEHIAKKIETFAIELKNSILIKLEESLKEWAEEQKARALR
jgi:hypothetical protein